MHASVRMRFECARARVCMNVRVPVSVRVWKRLGVCPHE